MSQPETNLDFEGRISSLEVKDEEHYRNIKALSESIIQLSKDVAGIKWAIYVLVAASAATGNSDKLADMGAFVKQFVHHLL